MDLLSERATEIQSRADSSNKAVVAGDVEEVAQQWSGLLVDLASRKDTLQKLAQHWEVNNVDY